jgi:hypothetical protein
MNGGEGMDPVGNRLVCGERAAMVSAVRRIPMAALPALEPTPPGA